MRGPGLGAHLIQTCMGESFVKFRHGFVFLASAALIAAGCGGDDGDKKSDDKASSKKQSQAQKIVAGKKEQVSKAEKAFDKKPGDINLCRDLAMKYVALASPESTGDPKKAPTMPKDRDKNLTKSVTTLEDCAKIDGKNRDVQQMLASTYMATGKYDKASPLLERLAKSAKGQERANAYYAWGLAASNAQDVDGAIEAWTQFSDLAPNADPRVAQVRQSIKALRAAKTKPAPAASTGDDGAKGDSTQDDT